MITTPTRNRTGRPLGDAGIRTKAKRHVDVAFDALADVAQNAADPAARVEAARTLIYFAKGSATNA